MTDTKKLYLELLKKSLTNILYVEYEKGPPFMPQGIISKLTTSFLASKRLSIVYNKENSVHKRLNGHDWPEFAATMVGLKRLDNLQYCIEDIFKNDIKGDFIEAGVWRGGVGIFMNALLRVNDVANRLVWMADSFAGLPSPDDNKYPADAGLDLHEVKFLSVSIEQVKENFKKYDLLNNKVRFLKGWFKDTLPKLPAKKLALIRCDGDLYESTMDILVNLYPKLSFGGYIIIDDWSMTACRKSVNDFRKQKKIKDKIMKIDGSSVFWQRLSKQIH